MAGGCALACPTHAREFFCGVRQASMGERSCQEEHLAIMLEPAASRSTALNEATRLTGSLLSGGCGTNGRLLARGSSSAAAAADAASGATPTQATASSRLQAARRGLADGEAELNAALTQLSTCPMANAGGGGGGGRGGGGGGGGGDAARGGGGLAEPTAQLGGARAGRGEAEAECMEERHLQFAESALPPPVFDTAQIVSQMISKVFS